MATVNQIQHLYRRFAFGITSYQARDIVRGGLTKAVDDLFDLPSADDDIIISPWRFVSVGRNFQPNVNHIGPWWVSQMILTPNPVREKITLFWHDHFAVGSAKTGSGFMLWEYIQTLRRGSLGNFGDLLTNVSKDPGMLLYLDSQLNIKGRPNENFAREVMELFTLGVDNGYSEEDIVQAAKAFTGWRYRATTRYEPDATKRNAEWKKMVSEEKQYYVFQDNKGLHEPGEKTVLGQKVSTGDEVLKVLIEHPQTARYISSKLWEYYAGTVADDKLVQELADAFTKGNYEITALLKAIATHDRFYKSDVMYSRIKCPVDYCIGLTRSIHGRALLEPALEDNSDPFKALPPQVRRYSTDIWRWTAAMGQQLLNPPDVEGWHWGESWISTDTVLQRGIFPKRLLRNAPPTNEAVRRLAMRINVRPSDDSSARMVTKLLDELDIRFDPPQRLKLIQKSDDLGGVREMMNPKVTRTFMTEMLSIVVGMPEAHLC